MDNNYIIKQATIDDINKIINLQEINNENILSYNSILNDLKNNELYYIILDNNNVIAYIATNNCYDHLDLISILVDKNYRNKHIGSYMINYLMNYIRNNNLYANIENIILEVRKSNLKAIKLYENNNYKYISIRKNYYKNEDALIYMARVREAK